MKASAFRQGPQRREIHAGDRVTPSSTDSALLDRATLLSSVTPSRSSRQPPPLNVARTRSLAELRDSGGSEPDIIVRASTLGLKRAPRSASPPSDYYRSPSYSYGNSSSSEDERPIRIPLQNSTPQRSTAASDTRSRSQPVPRPQPSPSSTSKPPLPPRPPTPKAPPLPAASKTPKPQTIPPPRKLPPPVTSAPAQSRQIPPPVQRLQPVGPPGRTPVTQNSPSVIRLPPTRINPSSPIVESPTSSRSTNPSASPTASTASPPQTPSSQTTSSVKTESSTPSASSKATSLFGSLWAKTAQVWNGTLAEDESTSPQKKGSDLTESATITPFIVSPEILEAKARLEAEAAANVPPEQSNIMNSRPIALSSPQAAIALEAGSKVPGSVVNVSKPQVPVRPVAAADAITWHRPPPLHPRDITTARLPPRIAAELRSPFDWLDPVDKSPLDPFLFHRAPGRAATRKPRGSGRPIPLSTRSYPGAYPPALSHTQPIFRPHPPPSQVPASFQVSAPIPPSSFSAPMPVFQPQIQQQQQDAARYFQYQQQQFAYQSHLERTSQPQASRPPPPVLPLQSSFPPHPSLPIAAPPVFSYLPPHPPTFPSSQPPLAVLQAGAYAPLSQPHSPPSQPQMSLPPHSSAPPATGASFYSSSVQAVYSQPPGYAQPLSVAHESGLIPPIYSQITAPTYSSVQQAIAPTLPVSSPASLPVTSTLPTFTPHIQPQNVSQPSYQLTAPPISQHLSKRPSQTPPQTPSQQLQCHPPSEPLFQLQSQPQALSNSAAPTSKALPVVPLPTSQSLISAEVTTLLDVSTVIPERQVVANIPGQTSDGTGLVNSGMIINLTEPPSSQSLGADSTASVLHHINTSPLLPAELVLTPPTPSETSSQVGIGTLQPEFDEEFEDEDTGALESEEHRNGEPLDHDAENAGEEEEEYDEPPRIDLPLQIDLGWSLPDLGFGLDEDKPSDFFSSLGGPSSIGVFQPAPDGQLPFPERSTSPSFDLEEGDMEEEDYLEEDDSYRAEEAAAQMEAEFALTTAFVRAFKQGDVAGVINAANGLNQETRVNMWLSGQAVNSPELSEFSALPLENEVEVTKPQPGIPNPELLGPTVYRPHTAPLRSSRTPIRPSELLSVLPPFPPPQASTSDSTLLPSVRPHVRSASVDTTLSPPIAPLTTLPIHAPHSRSMSLTNLPGLTFAHADDEAADGPPSPTTAVVETVSTLRRSRVVSKSERSGVFGGSIHTLADERETAKVAVPSQTASNTSIATTLPPMLTLSLGQQQDEEALQKQKARAFSALSNSAFQTPSLPPIKQEDTTRSEMENLFANW